MSDQHLQVQVLPGDQWPHNHPQERQQYGELKEDGGPVGPPLPAGWCRRRGPGCRAPEYVDDIGGVTLSEQQMLHLFKHYLRDVYLVNLLTSKS